MKFKLVTNIRLKKLSGKVNALSCWRLMIKAVILLILFRKPKKSD